MTKPTVKAPRKLPLGEELADQVEIARAVKLFSQTFGHPDTLRTLDVLADVGIGGSCSLRDRFACHAMQSAIIMNVMRDASDSRFPQDPYQALASAAYRVADAMIKERKVVRA